MDAEKLKDVLAKHVAWTRGYSGGVRADLSGANLHGADLSGADLSGADLSGAYLSNADLSNAYLIGANLRDADLSGANLSGANLSGANLRDAYLSGANLRDAYLSGAYLSGADLSGADLHGANLSHADLRGADLRGATLPPLSILPDGDIIGWKKLRGGGIAKLLIPAKARRVNSTGRKCRAEYAKVLQLFGCNGEPSYDSHTGTLCYRTGRIVYPDKYDPDFRVECSNGIHFFITREEAENY